MCLDITKTGSESGRMEVRPLGPTVSTFDNYNFDRCKPNHPSSCYSLKIEKTYADFKREENKRRCRQYRQRKRNSELEVHMLNLKLKRGRAELQEQIAELQAQIAVQQENAFLREELQVGENTIILQNTRSKVIRLTSKF